MMKRHCSILAFAACMLLISAGCGYAASDVTFKVNNSVSREDVMKIKCDNTARDTLRVGEEYTFHADFSVSSGKAHISDINYWFSSEGDFNDSHTSILFKPTDELNKSDWVVSNGEKRILESERYAVVNYPEKRHEDNIIIKYEFLFNAYLPDGKLSDRQERIVQCVHYAITRCGDGVVDKEFGEECDSGRPGGSATCTDTCKAVRK